MSEQVAVTWGMRPLIGQISDQVINELRLAGHAPIFDGKIVWGRGSVELTSRKAPPAISAIWKDSGATGAFNQPDFHSVDDPANTRPVLNALATDLLRLDFDCWGQVNPPDPMGDADDARYLCHQVWRVIHRLAEGSYRCLGITPVDAAPSSLGCRAVLHIEFSTAVVDNLNTYLPPGSQAVISVTTAPDGEIAAQFPTTPTT